MLGSAVTTALIDGFDSAQSESTGWNGVGQAGLTHESVSRNDDTTVFITLPPFSAYSLTVEENIYLSVPGSALTSGGTVSGQITASLPGQACPEK